jgi:prepilin-type N-terminal cleavage/methylation domain-containing protein
LNGGFTLVELLVVIGIIAILSSILFLSLGGIQGSQTVTKAAFDIQGVLDQARTLAMANNTYTWVGFSEEDPNNPGVAGNNAFGQVVISVVSSQDGTKIYTPNIGSSPTPTTLPSTSLNQVVKIIKIPGVKLYNLPVPTGIPAIGTTATYLTRPALVATTGEYQLGTSTTASLSVPASSVFSSSPSFTYPLQGASTSYPTPYVFTNIIQFSPQGDATRINDLASPIIEIGLVPAHGPVAQTGSANVVALQLTGVGGQITMYRP